MVTREKCFAIKNELLVVANLGIKTISSYSFRGKFLASQTLSPILTFHLLSYPEHFIEIDLQLFELWYDANGQTDMFESTFLLYCV